MQIIIDRLFNYLVKDLPLIKFCYVAFMLSAILFFLPQRAKIYLGISDITETYKGYVSILFIMSSIALAFEFIKYLYKNLKFYNSVNTDNLNDEERAILLFFINIQFESAYLQYDHPAVTSLKNRNFIEDVPMSFLPPDPYKVTDIGKKKLLSKKFQDQLSNNLNKGKALQFINSISDREYAPYSYQDLK